MASAIGSLEPGLFQLLACGVHPLHHTCLDVYTCLASAWRLHARGTHNSPRLGAVAHARAALYTLLLAHGLRQLLHTGGDFCYAMGALCRFTLSITINVILLDVLLGVLIMTSDMQELFLGKGDFCLRIENCAAQQHGKVNMVGDLFGD